MRKITEDSVRALFLRENFSRSNTTVVVDSIGAVLYLHGNAIAYVDDNSKVYVSTAGWPTMTTRERLSGVLDRSPLAVKIKQGEMYIIDGGNGESICKLGMYWTEVIV